MIDRRSVLMTLIATIAAGHQPNAASAAEPFIPLRRVARANDILFGFALDPKKLVSGSSYATFVAQQASIVVPENALKWGAVHPAQDRYDYTDADVIAAYARKHGLALRGHTFCWHRALPEWVTRTTSRDDAEAVLVEHIHHVAGHFKGTIQSWDVANEVINLGDGLPGGWRDCFWYRSIGPSYVDIACRAAHHADPAAVLCYNDYGLEEDGDTGRAKREAVLSMLRGLLQRGAPIGALGIQSHLRAGGSDAFGPGLARFILDVKSLGLTVYITELDVDDSRIDPSIRDAEVAGVYKRYLDLVLGTGAISAVLTWGVWDTPHYTGATGQNGPTAQRPLVFAPDGGLKDASWAVEHCLARARKDQRSIFPRQ